MTWEDFLILVALKAVELMNPDLIAAIINFLAELATLFASHPHIGTSAQKLTTSINAAAAGVSAAAATLDAPSASSVPVVTPTTPPPKTVGEIIAGNS